MEQRKANKQSFPPYSLNPGRLTAKKWYELLCVLTTKHHMRDVYGFRYAGRTRSVEYNERLILDLLESPLEWVRIDVLDRAIVEKGLQVGHGKSPHRLPPSQDFRKDGKRLFWLQNDVAPNLLQDRETSLQTVPVGAENGLHHTTCELTFGGHQSQGFCSTDYMACLCGCEQNDQVANVGRSDKKDGSQFLAPPDLVIDLPCATVNSGRQRLEAHIYITVGYVCSSRDRDQSSIGVIFSNLVDQLSEKPLSALRWRLGQILDFYIPQSSREWQ